MNKEYYEELKKKIEEFDSKNNPEERKSKILNFMSTVFGVYRSEIISSIIAFYEYTNSKDRKEEYTNLNLNEHYKNVLSNSFSKDKIETQFDSIVKDNDGLLLNTIISLGNDNVINDLISVSYEKANQNKDYIAIYESIKNKCINSKRKTVEDFLNFELKENSKSTTNVSDLGENILNAYATNTPESKPFEPQELDDSILKNHEERVAKAIENIGLDPSIKPLDKSINLDNFSSSNVSEVEKEKRYQEINENRKLAEEKADRIVEQAANELNIDKKDIYKALDKQGVNPLNLKPGDIVISSSMLRQVSDNNSVEQMNQSRYQRFINKLFSKISFKNSEIKLEVSEVDKSKKIVIAPGNKAQKIAKAENSLIKIQRVSQNVKKYFVDTKNNAKEAIKNTISSIDDKRQALSNSIKENVSNKLYDIADKISGVQENPYDVSNEPEIANVSFDNNLFRDDIQSQNVLNALKNKKVIALSGSLAGQIPYPLLAEASHKSM